MEEKKIKLKDVLHELDFMRYELGVVQQQLQLPEVFLEVGKLETFIFNQVMSWYKSKYGRYYPETPSEGKVVRRKYVEICHILGVEPMIHQYLKEKK